MTNLVQRTVTGVVMLAIIIGSIIISEYSFLACIVALLCLTLFEFYKIMKSDDLKPQSFLGIAIGIGFFIASYFYAKHLVGISAFVALVPLFLLLFIAELYKTTGNPFQNIAITLLGICYIAVPFSLFNFLVFNHYNTSYSFGLLLCLFSFNWTNDTGAYLFGISLGKHRLFERISPKKSWEGAIGGALCVVGMAIFFSHILLCISLANWIILGLLVSIFGVFGDLVESLLKRSLNIKDSGTFLAGHGGFLDRFDAVIFSTPVFFVYLHFIS